MRDNKVLKLTISAMFASLVCVATMIIQIPTITKGYINIGDAIVLLSGWLLGPVWGALSSAVGSCMADIFAGYPVYAIATFFIKGIVSLIAYLIYRNKNFLLAVISSVVAELFMAISYFLFECIILGQGIAAIAGLIPNFTQGAVCAILGLFILKLFKSNDKLIEIFSVFKK